MFEHRGLPEINPLLADEATFRWFLYEYSVGRTIRAGAHDAFRLALVSTRFLECLNDPSGHTIDKVEARLRPRFGVMNGQRRVRSAVSKVAAFLAPHNFVAYDKYALEGLARVLGSREVKAFTYAEYLQALNRLLAGSLGKRIRMTCGGRYPSAYAKKKNRFHRRVLDTYLMRIGRR